jgi:hypothetical protein
MASAAHGDCLARTFSTEYGWQGLLVEGIAQWDVGSESEPQDILHQLTAEVRAKDEVGFSFLIVAPDGSGRLWSHRMPPPVWIHKGTVREISFDSEDTQSLPGVGSAFLDLGLDDYLVLLASSYSRHVEGEPSVWIRRWSSTGLTAVQLRDALLKTAARRLAGHHDESSITGVLAAHARPMASATVWSGPPSDPALDERALTALMAEDGSRVICGDTTAHIAARLLSQPLRVEQVPRQDRTEVPPEAHLQGIHLVTEGLITLQAAVSWLENAETARDLAQHIDAATRLAGILLEADRIHFIVGKAVNPVQTVQSDAGKPRRLVVLERLIKVLRAKGKQVSTQYL